MSVLLALALTAAEPVPDFETDVVPVLTRFGCNAGACHGSAAGRGEFKLSLYGSDPDHDYEAVVRQFEGRRVNLAHPDRSLFVRKPTGELEHGGGVRLEYDGPAMRRLLAWIRGGAPRGGERTLVAFEPTPDTFTVTDPETVLRLRARARFDDGTTADVTPWTVFTAEDPSAVRIDLETGTATVARPGRHVVVARYLDRVVPVRFTRPLSDTPIDLSGEPRANFVDDAVYRTLEELRIPVSPPADDATFLRRVTLDLTGRLPEPDDVTAFLTDESTDKRERLVDRLLESDACNDYWTFQFAKLLRIRSQPQDAVGARTFHDWLRARVADGRPWDETARTLLGATGDSHEVGPVNFYRVAAGPRERAEFASELFLGVRLRCANCHDHPLDRWNQDDYHGLAAIFAKVEGGREIRPAPRGEVIHPRTGEPAVPRIPGVGFLDESTDGRDAFADWLVDRGNPYFARALVNRLWSRTMGRGLVEPVDDFRATNPATHPELLASLAEDFVEHGYDFRHTLRRICTSAAYARSARSVPGNEADDRYYARALVRPLEAEVLADAIADVTGVRDTFGDEPDGTRAVTVFDPRIASRTLDVLGRCDRDDSCESSPVTGGGLSRKLHLLNGPLVNRKLGDPAGRTRRLLTGRNEEYVTEFYLRGLSRPPTDEELAYWRTRLDEANDEERVGIAEDFVWSLVNCREFTTNH